MFERSDTMLKIRRNQELKMRISSIMFIRTNVGFHHEILKNHGVFPRALSGIFRCFPAFTAFYVTMTFR